MDVFTFALTLIVAFLGLLTGGLLSYYSDEEVRSFKKYIPVVQLIIFILVFMVIYLFLPFFVASAILVLSFAFIYLFWRKKNINVLDYSVLGVLFALTSLSMQFHLYMTLLVFAFGIFSGALFYVLHRNPDDKDKHVSHHKHSGKHLSFGHLLYELFHHYYFFLIIAFAAYLVAQILAAIF